MSETIYEFVRCPSCNTPHKPSPSDSKNGVYAAACVKCGHTFKFRAVLPFKTSISLTVDGKQYTVGNEYSPTTVLNSWLRPNRISVGTKHMCYEGGCGACLVEAKLYDPVSQTKISYAVNSCLLPLYSCDGMEIRTVDHIGNLRDGLHPVQKQLADYNGTQCGYCTPGQVMNMFALKERYGGTLTQKQVEDGFDGTICRCTGYRPILTAFKDMVKKTPSIGDIEDFQRKTCHRTGQSCQGHCSGNEACDNVSTHMVFADTQWYRPTTEKECTDILALSAGKKVRFLMGNTSTGVFREFSAGNYDVVIDTSGLSLMYNFSFDNEIRIGAGLTLSNLHDIYEERQQTPGLAFLGECSKYLLRIANLPVRNRGTWTGNICMKHAHNDFNSDVFVLLQVLQAKIWTGFLGTSIPIDNFLTTDINHSIIVAHSFTKLASDEYIKFYKVAKRSQNSHNYCTGGFRARVDKTSGLILRVPIVLAYSGLGATFMRATQTEAYLNGKQLTDPAVLQTALTTLKSEIQVDSAPVLSSPVYRTNLALSLFYKFVLYLAGDLAGPTFRSGASQLIVERPISSGIQTYDTVPVEYPVTEPLKKIEADAQVTGEATYVDDMNTYPDQLEAAFVLSTVGNARIGSIDPSAALKIPGVVKVLTARDIPGVNNITPAIPFSYPLVEPEEILASDAIGYCGQPVALVVAESYEIALGAARAVKVTYTDIQPPLLDINEAIRQQNFYPKPCDDKIVGDADQAIANAPRKVSGTISQGTQYHYHMETQTSLCLPTEDGIDVFTTTQFIDNVQFAISQITGFPKNKITVSVKRLGGGYGGKITRNNIVASACAMAAVITNKPVKLRLTMGDNMRIIGNRFPYRADYEAGFTETGQLSGLKMTYYGDFGYRPNDSIMPFLIGWADNAYLCPNWKIHCVGVRTNKSANTACRSPGSVPAIFTIESILEHVAKSLGKDATEVRMLNIYNKGATDPLANMVLDDCLLKQHIASLKTTANFAQRQQDVQTFNANNRWKKNGLSLVPLKFGIDWRYARFGCELNVYNEDGTVCVTHGGVEIGQGINTKVAQVCAFELGIPMSMIRIMATNSLVGANSMATGGSITTENCCAAVIKCCNDLNARIGPVRDKLQDKSWKTVINKCFGDGIDLSSRTFLTQPQTTEFKYFSYGATITEVEFDVLTGENQITRSDIQFDCGQSTNPALDIGQVEGAFTMGLGYWLTEEHKYDPQTGALLTDSTWEYKPPTTKDIPVDFRISLLKKSPNRVGVLGSKVSGEPPQCMSCSALFAIKRGIESARKDIGQDVFFPLNGPATPEACQLLCLTDTKNFVLQ